MKLSKFKFTLPDRLIAKYPRKNRGNSRLMVLDRSSGIIEHYSFKDLATFFESGDVLVLNNSRVLSCYLLGYKERTTSKVTVLLLRELDANHHLWDVWIDPARKIRVGNKLCFGDELIAEVVDNTTSRGRAIKFSFDEERHKLSDLFGSLGTVPLPKQLGRSSEAIDEDRYQNVYASVPGSVSAPYAGFHFTPYLLKYLELHNIATPSLTLHLSVNAFKKLEAEELSKYKVDTEYYCISEETASEINKRVLEKRKVCAVGTSTLKAMASSLSSERLLQAGEGWTNKFLFPPCKPEIATALLTNFHLPRTVDFINTLAFAGHELAMEAYTVAIEEEYRFFVYGDALLVL